MRDDQRKLDKTRARSYRAARVTCQAKMPQWRLRATTRVTPPASAITPAPAAIEATEPVLASVGFEAAGVPAGAFMLRMPPRAETGPGRCRSRSGRGWSRRWCQRGRRPRQRHPDRRRRPKSRWKEPASQRSHRCCRRPGWWWGRQWPDSRATRWWGPRRRKRHLPKRRSDRAPRWRRTETRSSPSLFLLE